MFGKTPWSKGLTKETDERILRLAEKCSKTKKEQWKKLPENDKNKIRKRMAIIGSRCNKKMTKIELKVKNFLDKNGIPYEMHFYESGFAFDFKLMNGLVIECQGDYWHANPLKYDESKINHIQKKI